MKKGLIYGCAWLSHGKSLATVNAGLMEGALMILFAIINLQRHISGRINTGQKKAQQKVGLDSTGITRFGDLRICDDSTADPTRLQTFIPVPSGRDNLRQQPGKTHYWGISTQCSGRSRLEAAGSKAGISAISSQSVRSERRVRLANSRPCISVVGIYGRASLTPEPLANQVNH